jgi:exopolysaccharide production protein ExoZ
MSPEFSIRPALLHGIQTMRGIFAVLVVCHHVGVHASRYWSHEWLDSMFNHSTFRVDFFFVLSGFVLWTAHRTDAGKPDATRGFLLRRFWRLYPLLITLSLFKMILICFIPGRAANAYQVIPSLLALPQSSFPVIVSAWTLSFEMFFMVMLAACLAMPRKCVLPTLLALAALLSVGGVLLGIRPAISGFGFLTHPFILEFAAGALVAECVRQKSSKAWGVLLCGAAAVGLFIGASQHSWHIAQLVIEQKMFWALVFGLGLGGLALWERSCAVERWWLRDRWNLGRASYSIFLSHGFVLMAVFAVVKPQMLGSDPLWINLFLLLVLAASVLFGLAVYQWWERPLMRWCKSLRWFAPEMQGAVTQRVP